MKFETYDKYLAADTSLPLQALATTWECLSDFHDELVLVGGLAVRYLTKPPATGQPGPVTLDVDFAVSLAVDGGLGPTIRSALREQDFRWESSRGRFTREFPGLRLHLDLLTDDGKSERGTAMLDDGLAVSVIPGIDRALDWSRVVPITGKGLDGSMRNIHVKVAEVGPMLALKLNAFGGPTGRRAEKDAHDILYLAINYVDGVTAAVAGFQSENTKGNRAMPRALACLRRDFADEDAAGPVACANFRLPGWTQKRELAEEALRIRQQCVTLALELLG